MFLLPRTFYFTSGLFLVRGGGGGGGLFLFNTNLFDFEQRIKTGLFIFPDPPLPLSLSQMLEHRVATLTAEVHAASQEMAEAKAMGLGLHPHHSHGHASAHPHALIEHDLAVAETHRASPPRNKGILLHDTLTQAPPRNSLAQRTPHPEAANNNVLPRPALDSFYRNHPEYKPNSSRTFFSVNPVDGLLSLCSKYGCAFRDYDFDTDAVDPVLTSSLRNGGEVLFRRLPDISPGAELFGVLTEAPSFDDIDWGPTDLAHWVMSCLAVVIQEFSAQGREAQRDPTSARNMGGARFMMHPDKENPHGIYVVRFFIDASWRYVVVDDLVPCDAEGRPLLPILRGAPGGMFLTLIIKALAKICNGYGTLTSTHPLSKRPSPGLRHPYSHVAEALCDMSGGVALVPSLPHPRSERFVAPWSHEAAPEARAAALEVFCDVMWEGLDELLVDNSAEVVAVASETTQGLARGAVYRILETATAEIPSESRKPIRLLRLHAPYGDVAWTGSWSPDALEWQDAPRLASALCPRTERDGSFWMEYVDLLNHFEYTAAVKEFTGWNELSLSGNMVYSPHRPKVPYYQMQLTQACKVFISIQERDPRVSEEAHTQGYEMGFKLVPESNLRAPALQQGKRNVQLQHHLQQGPLTQYGCATVPAGSYFLVPTCDPRHLNPRMLETLRQQKADLAFTLRVFARSAFVLVERHDTAPDVR